MEWIKAEQLPDTYEELLLYDGSCVYLGHYQIHDGGTDGKKKGNWYIWTDDGNDERMIITHWMPLPAPPED